MKFTIIFLLSSISTIAMVDVSKRNGWFVLGLIRCGHHPQCVLGVHLNWSLHLVVLRYICIVLFVIIIVVVVVVATSTATGY